MNELLRISFRKNRWR